LTELLSETDISAPLIQIQTAPESELAQQAKQSIIRQLLDRHGTGRLLFRNTRAAIKGFPTRNYQPIPLVLPEQFKTSLKVAQMMGGSASHAESARRGLYPEEIFLEFEGKDASWCNFDPRVEWLQNFLLANKNEKVLVIAANAETAMSIEESLRVNEGIRGTVFHEGMSIIERDKAGAYFAQEDAGAQVLLCSEIGSEGRNFQFAQHLVLFDLPLNPDLLEQRIGRLDRIGQQNDISIHVPFFTNTAQDILQNWYHNGLNAFEHTCPIGGDIFAQVEAELLTQLAAKESDNTAIEALISDTRSQYDALKIKMETGRDRLLELNSKGLGQSDDIIEQLKINDDSPTLPIFAIRLFDVIGVNQEDRGENMIVLKPTDQMLIPSLPHLSEDGITITFDRETALSRDDVHFLTWEHPLIRACIELIMTSDTGSTAVSLLKNPALPAGTILLELLYVVETSAPAYCQINRFLPATPIRLLLDKNCNNLAKKVTFDSFNRQLNAINRHVATKLVSASQTIIHNLINQSTDVAQDQKQAITTAALAAMQENMAAELERLRALQKINPNVRAEELTFIEKQMEELTIHINNAQLKLDAVRFIVVTPS
jgi:ATP-dependent helicase HepA